MDYSTPGFPVHHQLLEPTQTHQWCHPIISSSVIPFSCLQSFPASGYFQMSLFFASGGQSIGVSVSVSVLPMNIQIWFPYDGLVGSPCCPRDSQCENKYETASVQFSSVQLLSCIRLFATPWIAARQASLSITNSRSSPKLLSIKLMMPSSHLILCRPLLLLPPIPPSIRVFSNESTLGMRWPKYWSFRFSTIPSKEIPGLISFRMDWLDLHAVQGTLKSLLQHHSSKASILQHSAFFTVQLSHPYMTTGKTIALTRQAFFPW